MGVGFENFLWWTTALHVIAKYQVIIMLKAIFEN